MIASMNTPESLLKRSLAHVGIVRNLKKLSKEQIIKYYNYSTIPGGNGILQAS
jgi:hypothetical protein